MVLQISVLHDEVFECLMKQRNRDNDFYFRPRMVDRENRLAKGYWFNGDANYLQVSFWSSGENINKSPNIVFEITTRRESSIVLTAKDCENTSNFLQEVAKRCSGFRKVSKNEWRKNYSGTNFLGNLEAFLHLEKPIVDELIESLNPISIGFLNEAFHDKYVGRIVDERAKRKKNFNTGKPLIRKIS